MTISRSNPNPSIERIVINDNDIEELQCIKILGVFFSHNVKWDKQLTELYNKCCRCMSLVKRLKRNGNCGSVIWRAYMGFVYCHIAFCWPIICDVPKCFFKKFEQLDRIAQKWAHVHNLPPLRKRLDNICVKIIKKLVKARDCHPLSTFFQIRENNNHVRHTRTLQPLNRRSALYNNSFVKFCTYS